MKRMESKAEELPYESPEAEMFQIPLGLSVLEIVSLEGEVSDFEDSYDI